VRITIFGAATAESKVNWLRAGGKSFLEQPLDFLYQRYQFFSAFFHWSSEGKGLVFRVRVNRINS
jgi:hypothetical protein